MAVRRYLETGSGHAKAAGTDALWLGYRGPLSGDGIMQMLQRRGTGRDRACIRTCCAIRPPLAGGGGGESDLMRWPAGDRRPCCAATLRARPTSGPDHRRVALGDEL